MMLDSFWNDRKKAQALINEKNDYSSIIDTYKKLVEQYSSMDETVELLKTEFDEDMMAMVEEEVLSAQEAFEKFEIKILLSHPYDHSNAILELHPGAGGTESCDWSSMLLRMYTRFCEKNNYQYEIISKEPGEEAGIKEAIILIKGFYAYGYFKSETGVHRLVRISPFDSNSRRHTSFASVLITPEFNNNIDIEIKESDLKIDVYHSSGAGGQSVNTSNSAVRITHIPTKTVVTCQVERSQMMNKERAMDMLKSKLYQLELDKNAAKENELKGNITSINFGSQIRSYVLEPYTMVKDLRSNYSTTEAFKVLDGDILPLMDSVLKNK